MVFHIGNSVIEIQFCNTLFYVMIKIWKVGRFVLKKLMTYGMGIFFSKLIVFLLVPVYTRCFSPADYGYYDVLVSNITMVVSVSFLEIWSGVIRFSFSRGGPYRSIKTAIKLMPGLLVVYTIGCFVLSQIMELRFPVISVIYGLCYLLFTLFNSICRGLDRSTDYVISGAISTITACVLGLLSVVLHFGVEYLLIAQIIGYLLAVSYVEIRTGAVRKAIGETSSKADMKDMLMYCLPLMVNSFSFLFLGTYNKNIILNNLGETASGYYAFVLKFTTILSIGISIFSLSWQEVAFQNASNENRGELYSSHINSFIRFVGLGIPIYSLILYFAAPIIGGDEFTMATQYIPLAIMAIFVAELSGVLSIPIAVTKKTLPILLSTVVGATINIGFMAFAVERMSINVASLSLCIGFFFVTIYRYCSGKRQTGIRVQFSMLAIVFAEMVGVYVLFYANHAGTILSALAVGILVWIIVNRKEFLFLLGRVKELLRGRA